MALMRIRASKDKHGAAEAPDLETRLEVAARALDKRSSRLAKRKIKIDTELAKLRSSFGDSVQIVSKTKF